MTQVAVQTPELGQYRRPSPRMWRARQVSLALTAIPIGLAAAVPSWVFGRSAAGIPVTTVAVVLAAVAWTVLRGRYRSWGYLERADDLVVRRGLLFRQVTVVPYGRMQFIDVSAGPIDRIFGLATVQLHTAAAATDARIPGLEQQEADRLRDRLASLGEAQATGL